MRIFKADIQKYQQIMLKTKTLNRSLNNGLTDGK